MVLKPEPPAGSRGFGRMLLNDVVLPLAVAAGLAFIAVALIEGPPLEQFLYAVF
ncbi:MAG: hypothetical protein ACT4PU_06645 [Planctomycetota bacterium]